MPPRPPSTIAEPMAATTIRFPRTLLKRARIRAATDETTLQALITRALQTELQRRDRNEQRRGDRERVGSTKQKLTHTHDSRLPNL